MRPGDLILRGYVVQDDDSYFAICLDINIYARAESAEAAVKRCAQFVCEYINEAVSDDVEHAPQLLRRRAPWRFWVMYWFIRMAIATSHILRRKYDKPKRGRPFETPLPVRLSC